MEGRVALIHTFRPLQMLATRGKSSKIDISFQHPSPLYPLVSTIIPYKKWLLQFYCQRKSIANSHSENIVNRILVIWNWLLYVGMARENWAVGLGYVDWILYVVYISPMISLSSNKWSGGACFLHILCRKNNEAGVIPAASKYSRKTAKRKPTLYTTRLSQCLWPKLHQFLLLLCG